MTFPSHPPLGPGLTAGKRDDSAPGSPAQQGANNLKSDVLRLKDTLREKNKPPLSKSERSAVVISLHQDRVVSATTDPTETKQMTPNRELRSVLRGRDMWQKTVSEAYFPLDVETRDKDNFLGEMKCWSLGDIGLSRIHCDGLLYRRHKRHFLNETNSSLLITIPEDEEVQFTQSDRRTTCKPGGFIVERSDAPYEYWHGRRNRQWVLKVPTASVRARVGASERLGGISFDATQGVASYFLSSLHNTVRHVEDIDDKAREAAGRHLLELLCLTIRDDHRVLGSANSSIRAAHLARAEQFIRENLKDPDLSPQGVADACGISLRYLQRLFFETDQSINGYIRERRLNRCDEELRSAIAKTTVAEIAYRWGFADQSQFSKHYKARFGRTPTAARKEAVRDREGG